MNNLMLAAFLFAASTGFAQSKVYELKMKVALDGRSVAFPRMVVREGEKAVVEEESNGRKTSIEVTATSDGTPKHPSVLLKMRVKTVNEEGTGTRIMEPTILAMLNEESSAETGDESGKSMAISIFPTEKI